MEPVISVNLNGNAYQLEEAGVAKLRDYLDRAAAALADNPDRVEILADLEQAIADKCRQILGSHKTVITTIELEQVLAEMGPVDASSGENGGTPPPGSGASASSAADAGAPKRLFQIRDGAMISGLCRGLAAYLDIDVTIVRVVFVVLAFATRGIWLAVYGVLMFVIPYAKTSEEHAAAHGMPFNAKEVIDQAKRNYGDFKSKAWRRQWRSNQRVWKRQVRRQMREQAYRWSAGPRRAWDGAPAVMPLLNLLSAAWLFALIFALVSLVRTGAIFGWPLPDGIPMWAAAGGLVLVYQFVAAPLLISRGAVRADGVVSLLALAFLGWLAYGHVPAFHEFVQRLLTQLHIDLNSMN